MKGFRVWRHHFKLEEPSVTNTMSVQGSKEQRKKPFKVAIEGNIGSGKTTFLNYFDKCPSVEVFQEPLEKWRNLNGHNFLDLLYKDMKTYSGSFQSYVQLTRTQLQTTPPAEGVQVQIFERSVQSNRFCFLENAHDTGCILPVQYSVIVKWYEWLQEHADISLDLIVYLRSTPDIAYKRIKSRNREEEKNISLEFLESLHMFHEKWLLKPNPIIPVITIDANKKKDEIIKSCQQKVPRLFNYCTSLS